MVQFREAAIDSSMAAIWRRTPPAVASRLPLVHRFELNRDRPERLS